jgi:hypothetical protein
MRMLLTLLVLLCPLSESYAQEAQPLSPGTRIRVTVASPGLRREIGIYRSLTDTSLQLQSGASTVAISLGSVLRLEQSRGRKRSVPGGVLGFVLGVAAGGALGCLANRDDYGVFCGGQNDTKVVVGAALGAVAGAALGAVLLGQERWSPVELAPLRAR